MSNIYTLYIYIYIYIQSVCVYICIYMHTHTHTLEYYSAIKRNEIGSFVKKWMELEIVIQSQVSQKEKNKYCI